MNTVRKPVVAGMFYPGAPNELKKMLEDFLRPIQGTEPVPKALIAPHAGFIYSGPIAASAYAQLTPARDVITRVVLLGPSHRVAFNGLAVSSADFFATPLGEIPVDKTAVNEVLSLPHVHVLDKAHAHEHSLEVHLPFLQTTLNAFKLIPLVVGDASPQIVGAVLEKLWGGAETLIVVSSDLSHYLDYETACQTDAWTSKAIEALQPDNIQYEQACGRNPINGLLYVARQHGLRVKTLDLRNSGDTAGSKDRVVGYGAYAFN